jgi:endogenous inhibitor of DNA gyrase (YacG/DUF329 family)
MQKTCPKCNKSFIPKAPRQKYHPLCAYKVRSEKETERLRKRRGVK